MAILSDEAWAARLAERAERYAALHEPTDPPEPPAPPSPPRFTEADSEAMRQALATELDGFGAELGELLKSAREAQEQRNSISQETNMDEPVVLNQRERELVETFRRQEAERLARETLSANERAELERIDSLAAKALSKQGTLTPEETNALRTRVTSVLQEMNGAGRS